MRAGWFWLIDLVAIPVAAPPLRFTIMRRTGMYKKKPPDVLRVSRLLRCTFGNVVLASFFHPSSFSLF